LIKLSRYLLIFSFYQVLSLRSIQGSSKGLFLGAKGGNNDENHNHNDVGNFVLYLDGEPAIIDVGVATYTNRTFGKDRYKLWYMQSQWHNLPSINGVMQHEGGQYKAKMYHLNPLQMAVNFNWTLQVLIQLKRMLKIG